MTGELEFKFTSDSSSPSSSLPIRFGVLAMLIPLSMFFAFIIRSVANIIPAMIRLFAAIAQVIYAALGFVAFIALLYWLRTGGRPGRQVRLVVEEVKDMVRESRREGPIALPRDDDNDARGISAIAA
jgi:hypothetical protein